MIPRALLAGIVIAILVPIHGRSLTADASRPNILFVLADDLDLASMPAMPEVNALIAQRGVSFDHYFVSNSLCCPSRVTILRGQYAHNTGVFSNGGDDGGFEVAHRRGIEANTIATRLQGAGYRTGLFGKYLNGYPHTAGRRYIPPGWTEWASPIRGDPYSEYDYVLNHNGRIESYGHRPEDYGTDVYVRLAGRFIDRAVRRGEPFFAYVAPYAPHSPATPSPADVGRFAGATAPRTPSFEQDDVSRMPVLIRNLPRFTPEERGAIDRLYQRRLESLQAVDRGVAELIGRLRALGRLRDTYVVFTSDNGFHLGQHRLPAGKETPYDTDVHVPLLMRGPGIPPGHRVHAFADNADLAPTFAAMAGLRPARGGDGRSLLGLARGRRGAARDWRQVQLLEHWALRRGTTPPPSAPPGAILEPDDPDQADPRLNPTAIIGRDARPARALLSDRTLYGRLVKIPDYAGIRTPRYLYVEYANGDRELYDVATDPDEMHNLAGADPMLEALLAGELAALRHCRADSCRAAVRADVVGP